MTDTIQKLIGECSIPQDKMPKRRFYTREIWEENELKEIIQTIEIPYERCEMIDTDMTICIVIGVLAAALLPLVIFGIIISLGSLRNNKEPLSKDEWKLK